MGIGVAMGHIVLRGLRREYVEHLLGYVDRSLLKPLKVVVNAGNGGAGEVIDLLEPHLPFRFVKKLHHPDGNFPSGVLAGCSFILRLPPLPTPRCGKSQAPDP